MSLFSPLSLSTVQLLGQASQTAFGGPAPAGWSVYRTFDNSLTGASAIVLQNGGSYILEFRGTDDAIDVLTYPLLATGDYIHLFDSLLNSLPSGAKYYVTGASLGGGAANLLADIADTAYGGKFANATFVAFASPNISNANGIVNVGFENDPVYKAIELYGDQPSSLDNLVLATPEYMAGNYDGLRPYNAYAHNSSQGFSAIDRLAQSAYFDQMQPDSVVVFAATDGFVQDITPGRSLTGAFYLGRPTADFIVGRSGNDHLEGFGGNDTLVGGAGADSMLGGAGHDMLNGGPGSDLLAGEAGNDVLYGFDGPDSLVGGAGIDGLVGGRSADYLVGGPDPDGFYFTDGMVAGEFDQVADFQDGLDFTYLASAVGAAGYTLADTSLGALLAVPTPGGAWGVYFSGATAQQVQDQIILL